jgi:carboxypeptidase Q
VPLTGSRTVRAAFALALCVSSALFAQTEKVDQAAMQKIRDEGFNRSKIMETASWLTDVYGPRLTGSPNTKKAGDWTIQAMKSWGISNPHYEQWPNFGHGWQVEGFTAQVTAPQAYPIIAYLTPWSMGTGGTKSGEVVYARLTNEADLEPLRGKLRGKWIMLDTAQASEPHFAGDACRFDAEQLAGMTRTETEFNCRGPAGPQITRADSIKRVRDSLAKLGPDAQGRGGRGGRGGFGGAQAFQQQLSQFLISEGALGTLRTGAGRYGDGTVAVQGGRGPSTIPTTGIPNITIAAEHYGRIYRTIQKNVPVTLEVNAKVAFTPDTGSFNIVGEIPGSDPRLKDEVVMLGAHFDSWAGGTGATDNAAGSAIMLEAMRILKTLNLPMKRTVRIGLWTGEEQGLIGSNAYVRQHFGTVDSAGQHFTPEWQKLAGYFNVDNGTGAIRGIYAEHNSAVVPIFKQWLEPFRDLGATTVTLAPTTGTDHQSYDRVGLPGFQFIQDEIDYMSRTHHTNMDLYERLVPHDLMQNAVIVAAFVYDAANRDEKLPRKSAPTGGRGGRGAVP